MKVKVNAINQNEVLFHVLHALVQEEFAFLTIDYGKMLFQRRYAALVQVPQHHVLRQLKAN